MPRSHSSSSSRSPPVLNQAPKFHSPIGPIMSSSNLNKTPSYTRSEDKPSYIPPANSPGFFSSVKEGIGLGIGSSLGSRIVSGMFGPPSVEVKPQAGSTSGNSSGKCDTLQTTFNTCIQERKPVEECEQTLNLLNKCLSN
jgi:hypothetical protein